MLNSDDPKITALLDAWHRNACTVGRLKDSPLFIQEHEAKSAKQRTKFIALDSGTSGQFLVDRQTEMVYSIKGYGVLNLKKPRGKVEFLTAFINNCTMNGTEYQHTFWYKLHPTE